MPVVRFNGSKLDPATIRALVSGTLVNGSKPSVWWNRQSIDFRNSFMDTMRTSARNGESLTQAITRVVGGTVDGVTVPGIMKTTKAKAGALAATAQNAVANEAALKTFQQNNDVIKAVSQISTLDNRTSDICIAYSGQTWDVNTLQPIMGSSLPFNGGPPRHFNCRSRLRPVTKTFKELGVDADEIPAGTRASMDGQVPSDITFNQFLRGKSKGFQDDLLGPKRAQLWRNDDITLTQLVDMRGNPMSIAQLEARLGIKPKVDPLKRKPPAPQPKTKLVDSFLENDDGTFVQITQAEYNQIRSHAKRLTGAADDADELVTQQIMDLSDDVGAKFPSAVIDDVDVPNGSLEFRKKDLESTSRKIQTYARDRGITNTEAADQISDSLRYTYILDEDDYVKAIQETMERFAELGYKNNKFDPAWLLRPDYKGLNINMVSPQGVRMELQFHTAQSFEVKQNINHTLYEKFRKLSKAKQSGPEGQAIQAEMLANAQAIPVPKNIQFLEDLAKIYNKPDPAAQKRIFDAAKKRQAAAIKKEAKEKAKREKERLAKQPITEERILKEIDGFMPEDLELIDDAVQKLIKRGGVITDKDKADLQTAWRAAMDKKNKEVQASLDAIKKERAAVLQAEQDAIEAAAKKEAMTESDAVKSALKGDFEKLGEVPEVVALHKDAYAKAPSYIKSAIGQRKPLAQYVTEYKSGGGAYYQNHGNAIYLRASSHPNRIGLNATWRHEYGHAIDFDLAVRYYRLAGVDPSRDKWGVPIISARFNKSLLADSRKFGKWKATSTARDDYNKLVLGHREKLLEFTVPGSGKNASQYYEPLLKKHGITYKQIQQLAKNNFDLKPAHRVNDFVDEIFLPNMLASLRTGNVQGFFDVATQHLWKGGGDLASFSDYVGSITRNRIRGNWGHSNAYYGAGQHGPTGKHKEAFANFFGMMGGEDAAFFEMMLREWGANKYFDDLLEAMKLLEKG